MSRAQKIALGLIWLGIVGSIVLVLSSWQVRQMWLDPGGYQTVRRDLLTHEEDVWVEGRWVPLPVYQNSLAKGLTVARRDPGDPPTPDANAPSLPYTGPPGLQTAAAPDQPQQTDVTTAPAPAASSPARQDDRTATAAAPFAPGDDSQGTLSDDGIPIVRAPSPQQSPFADAPPAPSSDGAASRGDSTAGGPGTEQAEGEAPQPPA